MQFSTSLLSFHEFHRSMHAGKLALLKLPRQPRVSGEPAYEG